MKLLGWILLFIVLWLSIPFLLSVVFTDIEKWSDVYGPFGDAFGSVNALFSGLALAGVIYAILLQRKDLEIQSTELKLSRREFHLNRVSNIIYQQLRLVESAVAAISFRHPLIEDERTLHGYEALFILRDIVERARQKAQFTLLVDGHPRDIDLDTTIWNDTSPHILRLLSVLINSVVVVEEIVKDSNLDVADQEYSDRKRDSDQLLVLFERNIGDEIKILLNRIWSYSHRTLVNTMNEHHRDMANQIQLQINLLKSSNIIEDIRGRNDDFYLIKKVV